MIRKKGGSFHEVAKIVEVNRQGRGQVVINDKKDNRI